MLSQKEKVVRKVTCSKTIPAACSCSRPCKIFSEDSACMHVCSEVLFCVRVGALVFDFSSDLELPASFNCTGTSIATIRQTCWAA